MLRRLAIVLLAFGCCAAAQTRTKNIILVTADGLRWQELFNGLDDTLVGKAAHLLDKFGKGSLQDRRRALMPFFWSTIATRGVVLGNPANNSSVRVTNGFRVSYPGYSEILTGRAQDEVIRGNDKLQNPSETILEFVRRKLDLPRSKVALFASWDVFPFIGESRPGSIFINAGYQDDSGSPAMRDLSIVQSKAMTPWDSVRHDYVTLNMALDYMKRERPRVTYIALGETDDWAHDRRYDRVVSAIQYFDEALSRIAEFIASTPEYKDSTSIVITSDHGRGATAQDWHSHGKDVSGADRIWLAVMGPDTPARGEASGSAFQRDIAPTILRLLGLDSREYTGATGQPISLIQSDTL